MNPKKRLRTLSQLFANSSKMGVFEVIGKLQAVSKNSIKSSMTQKYNSYSEDPFKFCIISDDYQRDHHPFMVKNIIHGRPNFCVYQVCSKRDIGDKEEESIDPPLKLCC